MAHNRNRYLEKIILKGLAGSPIVGLLGQRQTGKTTLVKKISSEYVSLDEPQELEIALKTPDLLIAGRKSPLGIDECQESPVLFPALKECVRKNKKPGQFILTGSVRFTSVEDIRESLTGRMVDLELLPLTLSELNHLPLFDISRLAKLNGPMEMLAKNQLNSPKFKSAAFEFIQKGGLPGICFVRSAAFRNRKFRSHIKTILDRDLRKVTKTKLDYLTLKTFLEEIALQQGNVFDLSLASRNARIAQNTAKKILAGLESVFLVRSIIKQGETSGRLVYLEDQGMATFLLQERGFVLGERSLRESDWNRFLFQQLFAQLNYQFGPTFQISSFRTRGGLMIDFFIQIEGNQMGYSVTGREKATPHQFKSAQYFLKQFPKAKIFLLHQGLDFRQVDTRIFEVPLSSIL